MAATNPGDGSRAHRPYLESRRTTFVSRPSSQGLKPVSRLRGTAPIIMGIELRGIVSPVLVVVFAMRFTITPELLNGRPRQLPVIWQNMRCSILFHLLVPGGK